MDNVSFDLEPGHNYGILGANGAGKSTLLRLIAGSEPASSGHILRRAQVSYPLGFTGTFNGYLTGRQNIKFMARVYRRNVRSVLDFVWDFAELGGYFDMPVNTYSSGMIGRLSMGVSFAIDFDVYLVDEITAVGDARFRQKCSKAFQDRAQISDIIMVSHSSGTIKNYCDRIAILRNGQLELYSSVNEAMKEYARHMSTRSD